MSALQTGNLNGDGTPQCFIQAEISIGELRQASLAQPGRTCILDVSQDKAASAE